MLILITVFFLQIMKIQTIISSTMKLIYYTLRVLSIPTKNGLIELFIDYTSLL